MYLPTTMLPHGLRVLVDPPLEFPVVRDNPPRQASSSLWSRLRAARAAYAPPAPRWALRRSNPCAD
jgi:hypothetical protein